MTHATRIHDAEPQARAMTLSLEQKARLLTGADSRSPRPANWPGPAYDVQTAPTGRQ